jgi:hypothetical protein
VFRSKRKRALAVALGLAVAAGLAFALVPGGASAGITQNNAVWTSNGEAGYYAQVPTSFIAVLGASAPQSPSEQMGVNGGLGFQLAQLTPATNVVHLPVAPATSNPSGIVSVCDVAQIGYKWNPVTGQYDVYTGEGVLTYDPTPANPYLGGTEVSACTAGGALSTVTGTTHAGGFDQATDEVTELLGQGVGTEGIGIGQTGYLTLQVGDHADGVTPGQVKGIAQNLSNPVDQDNAHLTFLGTGFRPSFASAGTVYDNTERGQVNPSAPVTEAVFSGLRAATGVAHHAISYHVFSNWTQEGVESDANGTAADAPPAVGVSLLPYSVFDLYVGPPVGA